MKAERGKEAAEEKFEVAEFHSWGIRKEGHFHNIGEAASAEVEAAAGYPEDLAEIINEGGCAKQQIFSVDETAF